MVQLDPQPQTADQLAAGYQALASAAWESGLAHFRAAVDAEASAEAHEGLAMAAWWLDDVAVVFASRDQAYRLYRKRGDSLGAARCAIWIGLDHYIYRGDLAIADGWLQRAGRLLNGLEPTAEHGWLAIWSGHIALIERNDLSTAHALSSQTRHLAETLGIADLDALALALEGLTLVSEGQVAEGMRRLDEATTAALSGDVSDYDAIATICCYLFFACERVRDYDRAGQWCQKLEEITLAFDYRAMFPICRAHHAAVLIWRGDWSQAEMELTEAARQLTASRRGWAVDSRVRLGELRRRQGRRDEAASLFQQASRDPRSLLGQAELALDNNDPATAADHVERFLRRVPETDRTQRAAGLELAVRVFVDLNEPDRARHALEELEHGAALIGTEPLRAMASLARGRVAAAVSDPALARQALADAIDLFERTEAPYESALARYELARVLYGAGRRDAAAREAQSALAGFRSLGALPCAHAAETLLREFGGSPAEDSEEPIGLTAREIEVLRCLAGGNSNQQIADVLFISIRTVERHISTIYEKLGISGSAARAVATAYAFTHGIATVQT
jgi:DNA-binding CsgD family transcriptional regulator